MKDINEVHILGRVFSCYGLKSSKSGNDYLPFTIVTNYYRKSNDGKSLPSSTFHNMIIFGESAKSLANVIRKGAKLEVWGAISSGEYVKDGQKRYSHNIIVGKFQIPSQEQDKSEGDIDGKPEIPISMEVPHSEEDLPF